MLPSAGCWPSPLLEESTHFPAEDFDGPPPYHRHLVATPAAVIAPTAVVTALGRCCRPGPGCPGPGCSPSAGRCRGRDRGRRRSYRSGCYRARRCRNRCPATANRRPGHGRSVPGRFLPWPWPLPWVQPPEPEGTSSCRYRCRYRGGARREGLLVPQASGLRAARGRGPALAARHAQVASLGRQARGREGVVRGARHGPPDGAIDFFLVFVAPLIGGERIGNGLEGAGVRDCRGVAVYGARARACVTGFLDRERPGNGVGRPGSPLPPLSPWFVIDVVAVRTFAGDPRCGPGGSGIRRS